MIIDLTVPLNENTPVYPGDPKTKIEPAGVLANDGYCDHFISVGTHVGTHIDAPAHMIEGGKTLDQIRPEQFIGRGRYVKVVDQQFDLQAVLDADVQEGDIVLFHTGLASAYSMPEVYFEKYPSIPKEIAEYLVQQKVKIVGVDMCSPDHPEFPIHKIPLGGDVLIIENLTNLQELEGLDFRVYALPLNLQIDGSPARVIADAKQ